MPVSDGEEDSGNEANGDSEGQFVPVSDDDKDSGNDANGDSEGWFVLVSDDDAKMVTVKGRGLCP